MPLCRYAVMPLCPLTTESANRRRSWFAPFLLKIAKNTGGINI